MSLPGKNTHHQALFSFGYKNVQRWIGYFTLSNWRFHVAAEVSRSCNGVIFQMSLGVSPSAIVALTCRWIPCQSSRRRSCGIQMVSQIVSRSSKELLFKWQAFHRLAPHGTSKLLQWKVKIDWCETIPLRHLQARNACTLETPSHSFIPYFSSG